MKKRTYLLAALPFIVLAGMFEILPVLTTIVKSFLPEGGGAGLTLENYISIFTKPLYVSAIKNSLFISIASSAAGLLIAFAAGKAACERGGKVKRIFMRDRKSVV